MLLTPCRLLLLLPLGRSFSSRLIGDVPFAGDIDDVAAFVGEEGRRNAATFEGEEGRALLGEAGLAFVGEAGLCAGIVLVGLIIDDRST